MKIKIELIVSALMLVVVQEPVSAGFFTNKFGAFRTAWTRFTRNNPFARGNFFTARRPITSNRLPSALQGFMMAGIGIGGASHTVSANKPTHKDNYNKVRENFKEQLYDRQRQLMGHDAYVDFIEPYVQEAERVLKVPGCCAEDGNLPVCRQYFDCLLDYNVACFYEHVKPNAATKKILNDCRARLASLISRIKDDGIVKGLNVQEELQKTEELFKRANAAYYKKLGYGMRFIFWLS